MTRFGRGIGLTVAALAVATASAQVTRREHPTPPNASYRITEVAPSAKSLAASSIQVEHDRPTPGLQLIETMPTGVVNAYPLEFEGSTATVRPVRTDHRWGDLSVSFGNDFAPKNLYAPATAAPQDRLLISPRGAKRSPRVDDLPEFPDLPTLPASITLERADQLSPGQIESLRTLVLAGHHLLLRREKDIALFGVTPSSQPIPLGLGSIRHNPGSRLWTVAKETVPATYRYPNVAAGPAYIAGPGGIATPFQASLPGVGRIAGLLGLYFVLVLPLNFLVLKRARKPEWAWVTAPLLGLGFAAYMTRGAEQLGKFGTSQQTQTTLVVDPASPRVYVSESVRYFSPQAGIIDPHLKDLEEINRGNPAEYSYGARRANYRATAGENGMRLEPFSVRTRGFGEFGYSAWRDLDARKWFEITRDPKTDHLTVVNRSPYVVTSLKGGADLEKAPKSVTNLNLRPGQSHVLERLPVTGTLIVTVKGYRSETKIGKPVGENLANVVVSYQAS